jgi:hypothetical protein
VSYTKVATISTDTHHSSQEFRASIGAQWPFLEDPDRIVQKDLDIQEYTDSEPVTAKDTASVASCTLSYSSTGAHSITAEYLADANFAGSTSPRLTVTVTRAKTQPGPKVVAKLNLYSPGSESRATGTVKVLKQGNGYRVAIVARDLTPNNRDNAYAVWLYNSPRKAKLLGFVYPGVPRDGRLSTADALPSDARRYREIIITLEVSARPTRPGPIELQGRLRL